MKSKHTGMWMSMVAAGAATLLVLQSFSGSQPSNMRLSQGENRTFAQAASQETPTPMLSLVSTEHHLRMAQ